MAATKSAREKAEARQARMADVGIPDSPRFGGKGSDPYAHLRELHIGGKRVGDFDESVIARLTYDHTDEGIEERNRGRVHSAAREISGPREKKIAQRRDFLGNESFESWEAPDPLKELAAAHAKTGMKAKFLSPDLTKRKGLRGYEVVKDVNGDPVRLGELILGHIPIERAEARNRHYQDIGNQKQRKVVEQFEERARQLSDERIPAGRRKALPVLEDGLQDDRGFAAND